MTRMLGRSALLSAAVLAGLAAWSAAQAFTVRECESISSQCSTLCNRYAANATIAGQCVGNCLMKELSCKSNASDKAQVFGGGGVTLMKTPQPQPVKPKVSTGQDKGTLLTQ
jgi:hypothetical protein